MLFINIRTIPALLAALSVGLGGCGITTGNDVESTLNDDLPDTYPYIVNGLYQGPITNPDSNLTLFALNGTLRGIDNSGTVYAGEIETNANGTFGASLLMYDNGGEYDGLAVAGTYRTRGYLSGITQRVSGGDGELQLEYNRRGSEQPASVEGISGHWEVMNASDTTTLTIDPNGEIYGSDTRGCQLSGRISAPDPDLNLFHTNLTLSGCGRSDGSYYGISARGANVHGDTMTVLVSNEIDALYLDFNSR